VTERERDKPRQGVVASTLKLPRQGRQGRTIWIADAHRGDGKRFVMRADEKLTAFVKLESAIRRAIATTTR
jgi:hypothetical protein